MEVTKLPLAELAGACREENARFLRHEPARDDFCFELLRRAVLERDQRAWDAVFTQYRGLVLSWIRRHSAAPPGREDDDYWLNRAFERFWGAVGPERFGSFPNLAALLRYLKLCVHSVLLDEARARGSAGTASLDEGTNDAIVAPDPAGGVVAGLAGRELWATIEAELRDDGERLVAYLGFALDLKPREIYERYPERYKDVADVYRVKRNLLDRLRRSPAVGRFLH